MIKRFFALALAFSLAFDPSVSFAQGVNTDEEEQITGPRKQLATIIFTGLAGAILGLSTLSFYGRPQDNLKNIAIGFAVGVIGGTAYASYKAAVVPEEFYGMTDDFQQNDFYHYYRPNENVVGPIYVSFNF